MRENSALASVERAGLDHEVVRYGRVRSLPEAAAAIGVAPRDIVKSLVVRRGEGDHLLVLVPGDREIAWPKLRQLLGVSRLSMPDAGAARDVTGFERGTISPFGLRHALPVVADATLTGDPDRVISLGGGEHGVSLKINAEAALVHLGARVADVTDAG